MNTNKDKNKGFTASSGSDSVFESYAQTAGQAEESQRSDRWPKTRGLAKMHRSAMIHLESATTHEEPLISAHKASATTATGFMWSFKDR